MLTVSYAKLFSSITESSLWSEPKEVRLLFVTMLAKANSIGFVEASILGLARVANLSQEEVEESVKILEEPDPFSKNADLEGRRIAKVPGGWMVLNYEEYRSRTTEEERKEYMRDYMRKYRAEKGGKQSVNNVKKSKDSPSASSYSLKEIGESERKGRCTQKEAEEFCVSIGLSQSDGKAMFLHWEEKGWGKVKDWKATIRKWQAFGYMPSQKGTTNGSTRPRALSHEERKKAVEKLKARRNEIFREAGGNANSGVRASYSSEQQAERDEITRKIEQLEAV